MILCAANSSNTNQLLPMQKICKSYFNKAELLQEGIFFPHPFICQRRFSNEKVGNRKN